MNFDSYVDQLTFETIRHAEDEALAAVVKKPRYKVIEEISESGLRGRGGAGFPTGKKWEIAASRDADYKFVICNADEGEPGTFKDRVLISRYTGMLCEAMTIAAYAIGAEKGYIYLREEYIYLKELIEETIRKRKEKNLLGENILGKKGFNFDIELRIGAGAYMCGEESALIKSIEGKRGEPENKPPFPAEKGLGQYPTVVNNVETFLWVNAIILKGIKWFKDIGSEKSPGPKIMSVSGDCKKPGIYEFPMGISINTLLEKVEGTDAKAVQIGGAAGICVPSWEFQTRITYEDVSTGGSVIIFGQDRNLLDIAENFLEFFVEESCGQCTPCRLGIPKLLEGIKMLKKNDCPIQYLNELIKLAETIKISSKCGLGQSAPNPFLSVIHILKKSEEL